MNYLKSLIIVFLGIIISLAFAKHDFSTFQFGKLINTLGYISAVAIPIGLLIKVIKDIKR